MSTRLIAFTYAIVFAILFAYALMYISSKPASAAKTEPEKNYAAAAPAIAIRPCPKVSVNVDENGEPQFEGATGKLHWSKRIIASPAHCYGSNAWILAQMWINELDRTGCKWKRVSVASTEDFCSEYEGIGKLCVPSFKLMKIGFCPGGRVFWEEGK